MGQPEWDDSLAQCQIRKSNWSYYWLRWVTAGEKYFKIIQAAIELLYEGLTYNCSSGSLALLQLRSSPEDTLSIVAASQKLVLSSMSLFKM